jgi:streptomycin 6-kinase
MRVPRALVKTWGDDPEWLAALPRLVAECAAQWSLELEEPIETPHSLVVPAGEAVLKLNAPPHVEAEHEAEALARWNGDGAVRLLAHDEERRALLLERCRPGTRLRDSAHDAAVVVAGLLPRLQIRVPDGGRLALVADEADRWADEIPRRYADSGRPFERKLLELAADVYRTVDRTAAWLVNQDLHGGNVLRAEREPWLVIDPKPLLGERELEASGLLRNAEDVTRWLDVLAGLGLDRERVRGWGVAHTLAWAWSEHEGWIAEHVDDARRILNAP